MGIFTLLVICALIGFAAWALTNFVPMTPRAQQAVNVVAVLLIVLVVLQAFGLLPLIDRPVPRLGG